MEGEGEREGRRSLSPVTPPPISRHSNLPRPRGSPPPLSPTHLAGMNLAEIERIFHQHYPHIAPPLIHRSIRSRLTPERMERILRDYYRFSDSPPLELILHPENIRYEKSPRVSISEEQVKDGLCCSICFDDFGITEEARPLKCGHLYHPTCITDWFKLKENALPWKRTCPLCRRRQ